MLYDKPTMIQQDQNTTLRILRLLEKNMGRNRQSKGSALQSRLIKTSQT